MPVTPTGSLGLALNAVKTIIAASAAFQTWCGVAIGTPEEQAAEALTHLHIAGLPPPDNDGEYNAEEMGEPGIGIDTAYLPYGLVFLDSGAGAFEFARDSVGGTDCFSDRWRITVTFVGLVPADYRNAIEDAELWFLNHVGGVVDDLRDLAGQGTYLNVMRITKGVGPIRSHPAVQPVNQDHMAMDITMDCEG